MGLELGLEWIGWMVQAQLPTCRDLCLHQRNHATFFVTVDVQLIIVNYIVLHLVLILFLGMRLPLCIDCGAGVEIPTPKAGQSPSIPLQGRTGLHAKDHKLALVLTGA